MGNALTHEHPLPCARAHVWTESLHTVVGRLMSESKVGFSAISGFRHPVISAHLPAECGSDTALSDWANKGLSLSLPHAHTHTHTRKTHTTLV